jgi:hypothetical protein
VRACFKRTSTDNFRVVNIDTILDVHHPCVKNTADHPLLGLISLPSPSHTVRVCNTCNSTYEQLEDDRASHGHHLFDMLCDLEGRLHAVFL